jgi:hypothetical protein
MMTTRRCIEHHLVRSSATVTFHAVGRAVAVAINAAFGAINSAWRQVPRAFAHIPVQTRSIRTTRSWQLTGCVGTRRVRASNAAATNASAGSARASATRSAATSSTAGSATTGSTATSGTRKGCGGNNDHCSCKSCFQFHTSFSIVSAEHH